MTSRMLGWGVAVAVVGIWIWLTALGVPYVDFGRNWPLLLVALGIYIVVRGALKRARRRRSADAVIAELEAGRIDVDEAVSQIRRAN